MKNHLLYWCSCRLDDMMSLCIFDSKIGEKKNFLAIREENGIDRKRETRDEFIPYNMC